MKEFAVSKKNFLYIIVGFLIVVLGYALMVGGGSDDPNVFNYKMFNAQRIIIAPLLIIGGFIVQIIFILKRPKNK